MIVVNTNIISYSYISSDRSDLAEKLLTKDFQWKAPVLWRSEFRSVFGQYLRKELLQLDEILFILQQAEKLKIYLLGKAFNPLFEHNTERVLLMLSRAFGDGIDKVHDALLSCELPPVLNRPSADILATVTRAIHQKKAIRMQYYSHSSGLSKRKIVPFSYSFSFIKN